MSASQTRFEVRGGPGGYLCVRPIHAPDAREHYTDRWPILFRVNRPLTAALRNAALDAALRGWEIS